MALADLIDAHRAAFEYDWRTRFGKSLRSIGRSMPWGEALRQTETLLADPSSHVASAAMGWTHPVSWYGIVAMDDFDLKHQIAWVQGGKKGQRPKPYPRPWPDKVTKTLGSTKGRTQEEIMAVLRAAGHLSRLPGEAVDLRRDKNGRLRDARGRFARPA